MSSTNNLKVDPFAGRRNNIISSLISNNAQGAIDYYINIFNARVVHMTKYKNKIAHAEIEIGNTTLMLSDELYGKMAKSAETIGDTPVTFYIYTENVDDTFNKAVDFGAKILYSPEDQFYGDRVGTIKDPYGFKWTIATHIFDMDPNKMEQGMIDMIENKKHLSNVTNKEEYSYDILHKKYLKYKTKYLNQKNNP